MAKNITPKPEEQNGKNIFNAPVKVGRDFIAGDQVNYNIQAPTSRQEFLIYLNQVQQTLIAASQAPNLTRQQVETVKFAQIQLTPALEEAQKQQPMVIKIKTALDSTKSVMESLDESIKTAIGLGSTIALLGTLAANAAHLFGM